MMFRTVLLALALGLSAGAPHLGQLADLATGMWAAVDAGGHYDPDGATVDAGNGFDPDGLAVDAGNSCDPNG